MFDSTSKLRLGFFSLHDFFLTGLLYKFLRLFLTLSKAKLRRWLGQPYQEKWNTFTHLCPLGTITPKPDDTPRTRAVRTLESRVWTPEVLKINCMKISFCPNLERTQPRVLFDPTTKKNISIKELFGLGSNISIVSIMVSV